jgi:hypothetical protein
VTVKDDAFANKLQRVERAMASAERLLDAAGLEVARELVTAILDVHHDALEDLIEAVEGATGEAVVTIACRPRVAWLLGLHGINPDPLEGRAHEALRAASVAPGDDGRAEIVRVEGERVSVRVLGTTEAGRRRLTDSVERQMAALAPEAELVFEGLPSEPNVAPLYEAARLVRRRGDAAP